MFESLKSKMKKLFSKGDKLDEKTIYKEEPTEHPQPAPQEPTQDAKGVEEPVQVEEPTPSSIPEVVPEVPAEEPKVDEPKLSRKEMMRLKKQQKIEAKKESRSSSVDSPVGDSGKKIDKDALNDILDELEIILLEADVAYPVAMEIKDGVRENLIGKRYDRSYTLEQVVEMAIKDAVRNVLKINEFDFDAWLDEQEKPTIVMFIGINGTGKTTAIAKIANRVMNDGRTVVLAACDTFRAGAIEQLTFHSEKLGCKIVKHEHDGDPSAVAYDAIEHARSKRKDVVLIDTAGRMQTNNNLIEEMKKIVRVAKPDLKIFVGDSLAGNDAIEQAKVFDQAVGIDAIILTKIDTDAKGGAALSIAHTINKPIAFVCNGQEYADIVKFDTEWMIDRLFE